MIEEMEFLAELIRDKFDAKRQDKETQLKCIKAAEEIFLNELAEQMKSDYYCEHN